ncbi:GNAT family N-acetyltransferase [Streptomyces sp. NRRL B-1347]|uniref:GNAT family N-acetyltransferase n=1 Tax=Streptomyces sp. NRRL B-1347 TaxID=1476877 RepID=UPI0004CB8FCF|nr:GNAT family N-acetyltransferase [Streptomyces sp. NRRL B-1347]
MDIVIRRARPAEYAALGDLTVEAYLRDGFLAFGAEDGGYRDHLRDVAGRADAAEVLVAVAGEQLLGGVTFVPSAGPMTDIARADEAEVRMLAVARAARGRGAGEALVRACVERARAAERAAVVLSTQPTMRAAQRLYERLGFVRAPRRDWEPVPGLTLLSYELTL